MDICKNSNYIPQIIKKHKLKKKIKKVTIILFISFLILFLFLLFIVKNANPIAFYYGEGEVKKIITKSCNEAIFKTCKETDLSNLIDIVCDNDGNITYLKANSQQINLISNKLALFTQERIDENSEVGVDIPIGSFSGISFLSGKGSKINFTINPIGNVICNFYTTLSSSGINQSSHKIYVNIKASCFLILPLRQEEIVIENEFLLTECLIVGKVPNMYIALN